MAIKVSGTTVIDGSRNIVNVGNVDGRDISVDGTKLDGIESGAEVNTVDSVNSQTGVVVLDADDIGDTATTNKFTTAADISKLAGIESGADVTDTANVTAAGALMDSEVTNLAQVKAFDSAEYATASQGALADSAVQPNDSPTFGSITVTGTVDGRDVAVDGTKLDGIESGATADQTAGEIKTAYESNTNTNAFTDTEQTKLAGIETGADVTDAGNVNPLVDSHLNTSSATSGQYLGWNGADYAWSTVSGYTDADVDTHLNTGTAASGEVLSWTGSDYDWIAVSGGATDINGLTDGYTDAAGATIGLGLQSLANDANASGFGANIGLGFRTLNLTTTGVYNTAVGYDAMRRNQTNNFSTAVGFGALRSSRGDYNTGFGYQALQSNTTTYLTGSNNVGLGTEVGSSLSTGSNNFLGGYRAGYVLTTGSNNVALGNGALDAATTGGRNIAIGQGAMGLGVVTNATGNNIAIGYQAGQNITSAVNMVAIGSGALKSASYTANGSVALGFEALSTLVDYGNNTAVGYRAGASLNESENTAIGYFAAESLTTGFASTAVGSNALRSSTGASEATAIGADALTQANGRYNTGVGRRAGASVTSGQQNTLLGYQSGRSGTNDLTTGSNNTVIGYNAAASSATVSNEITLGNTSITRFRVPGAGIDNTSAALSGTTPSVDVGARDTYTLTTSGNTTFTFTGVPSSGQVGTFSLIITAGGTHTLTWPASVDWAGGTAPDAPASGEKDIYTFMTVDGGTTWYGFQAGDAMA